MCFCCHKRQFADACGQALDVNERLIKEDQLEYQEELRSHYKDMLSELSAIMNEQVRLTLGWLELSLHRKCPSAPQCQENRKEPLFLLPKSLHLT